MQHAIDELKQYPTLTGTIRGIPTHINYFDEAFHGESELYEVLNISGYMPLLPNLGGRYDSGKWVVGAFINDVFWSVCRSTLEEAIDYLLNAYLDS